MTDNERFTRLLAEFRRVGVDPDTFSAVISVTPDEALRVLHDLDDDAGPAAFLSRLRRERAPDAGRLDAHGHDVPAPAP
jgi:hypothetical protein